VNAGDAVQSRGSGDSGGSAVRCPDAGALQRLQRGRLPGTVRPVSKHAAKLGKSNAFRGDRHNDACEARLGLAQLERLDRIALRSELVCELVETEGLAGSDRIAAERRPEGWVHDQPLDQLAELFVVIFNGCHG
jgi:hypothetical protein